MTERPYFGNCSFCDKVLETKEEANSHMAPCLERQAVDSPAHYTSHPSGMQCITVTEHMNFCLGNAMKYIWRADLKGGVEDLKKARWYIEREIKRRRDS